jgi:hypothetical protein
VKAYRDRQVEFSYPEGFNLQANVSSGAYTLQRGKELVATLAVLEPAILAGVFESMSKAVPPTDVKRDVFEKYVFGGKGGRAIEWTIPNTNGDVFAAALDFFMELPPFSVAIKIMAWPLASVGELETFVASLRTRK